MTYASSRCWGDSRHSRLSPPDSALGNLQLSRTGATQKALQGANVHLADLLKAGGQASTDPRDDPAIDDDALSSEDVLDVDMDSPDPPKPQVQRPKPMWPSD